MRRIIANSIDERMTGQEPDPKGILTELDYMHAYDFYNYHCDFSDCRTFIEDYMRAIGYRDNLHVKQISAAPDSRVRSTQIWLMRLHVRGVTLSKERIISVNNRLEEIRKFGEAKLAFSAPVINIQQRIDEIVGDYISDIDSKLDTFCEGGCVDPISFYDLFNSKGAKAIYIPRIIEYYTPLAAELLEARKFKLPRNIKTDYDLQMNEAYRLYTKKQLIAFSDLVNSLIEDCNKFAGNIKRARKPSKARKKKERSADQVVKNMKYLKSDEELKVVSINPMNIVGAAELWTFNSMYNVMYHYVAMDRGGLSVKGTTIINFNEKASEKKKIRKPEQFLPTIINGGPKQIAKNFSSLKTKSAACNGRLNDKTLILRAIR